MDSQVAETNVRPKAAGRRPARRVLVIVLVLLALAAVGGLAWMLTHRGGETDAGGPGGRRGRPATTVGVATARVADVPITLEALGTVTPAATVTVRPQVSGVITRILFREGQMVRQGETLAVIDPRPFEMAVLQAQGQLERDQAELANARLTLQRYRTLLAQDSIARQDVDTQAALVRQLEGSITADRAAVGTARLNLGYSRVIAPVSGRVGLRVIDVGNFIAAGDANGLVVLTQVAPIDVVFTLPQDDVPRVQARAAQATLPVTAFDRTRTMTLGDGVFSTLDNRIDITTGTVKAKARFPNGTGSLFPSQFVNVRMGLDTLRGVVTVPVSAVRAGNDGDFVWLLNADRTVSRRKVVRGPATVDRIVVTQGLNAGDRVITEGGDRLTDGGSVQLAGDRNAQQACAADAKKLCGGKQGREMMRCIRQNQDKVSAGCKAAVSGRGRAGSTEGGGSGSGASRSAGAPAAAAPAGEAPSAQAPDAPSPQAQDARAAMRQACAADLQKLCPGLQGRERFMCLRENSDKLGAACKAALASMPRRPQGGAGPG